MNIWRRFFTRRGSDLRGRNRRIGLVLALLLAVSVWLAVQFGSTEVSVGDAFAAYLRGDRADTALRIVAYVRLPRVLAAILAGSALAVAGVIIQAVLNNPMAAPNIIGVNAGAGLMAILTLAVIPSAVRFLPLTAFAGAMGACLCIYAVAARTGASRMTITLVGIAVSSMLTAGINTVKTLVPDSVYHANAFLIGGLQGVSYASLHAAWLPILIGIAVALFLAKDLDLLSLGGEVAASLGMHVRRTRFLMLMLASLLAGSAVSFAGLLGFVGLVVPHIARRLVGNRHRLLIPVSAAGGAVLVLLCDLLCRVLFAPYEIPVGILLSFIGGPFFILLILMQRKHEAHD